MAHKSDSVWTTEQLGENVIAAEELAGGHLEFFVGKSAKYFTDSAMSLIKEYNPVY